MMELSQFGPADRLLVFAPHPDDETLATGALIQAARASAVAVRVIFATDGENNPWPQRWIERRWRIGPAERARWGARRRAEAAEALRLLGLDSARDVRFMGWPDQGLTDILMRDGSGTARLASEIAAFAPTRVVMPALADHHPDHSALRVMLDIALLSTRLRCLRLGYVVHGHGGAGNSGMLPMRPSLQRRKREALAAHASQVRLSRRRLYRIADRPERFELSEEPLVRVPASGVPLTLEISSRGRGLLSRRTEILLVAATATDAFRLRAPLPLRKAGVTNLIDSAGRTIRTAWHGTALGLTLPAMDSAAVVYVKLHRADPRLLIFDREPWQVASHAPPATRPAETTPVAVGMP